MKRIPMTGRNGGTNGPGMARRRLGVAAVAMAAVLGIAGCTAMSTVTELVGYGGSAKIPPLPDIKPTASIRTLWQASMGATGEAVLAPAVDDEGVYVAGKGGVLARLDPATGRQMWRVDTGRRVAGGVGIGPDIVLVGTLDGDVLAYDRNGRELWQSRVTSEVLSPPQADEGFVVVRTADGRVFGLDMTNGKRKWAYQRPMPALTLRSHAGVVITRGAVFAGFPGGKLVAQTLSNGAVGWEATVAQPKGATELERVADVSSVPVVDDKQVCAVAYQGRVACFDIQSGSILWAREFSSNAGMELDARNAYLTDDRGIVMALDKGTGSTVWKQEKLSGRQVSRPADTGSFVIAGDIQGYLHVIRKEDGSLAARAATDGTPIMAAPVTAAGNRVFVQTRDGGVYAMAVQ